MRSSIILFALIALATISCKKEKQQLTDSLVFSTYYGMCGGNCFNVYRIDNTKLQEDEIPEHFTNMDYVFTSTKTFDEAKYNQVKYLLNEIPAELKGNKDKIYGCPDCYDQGGVYVKVTIDGVTTNYNIDNGDSVDQSAEIIEFKTKVHNAVFILAN